MGTSSTPFAVCGLGSEILVSDEEERPSCCRRMQRGLHGERAHPTAGGGTSPPPPPAALALARLSSSLSRPVASR